jgi:hypothetical protein
MPTVGDLCCADPEEEGVFLYGVITRIEGDIAYSDLMPDHSPEGFGGDVPTSKRDGIWVFTSF